MSNTAQHGFLAGREFPSGTAPNLVLYCRCDWRSGPSATWEEAERYLDNHLALEAKKQCPK